MTFNNVISLFQVTNADSIADLYL